MTYNNILSQTELNCLEIRTLRHYSINLPRGENHPSKDNHWVLDRKASNANCGCVLSFVNHVPPCDGNHTRATQDIKTLLSPSSRSTLRFSPKCTLCLARVWLTNFLFKFRQMTITVIYDQRISHNQLLLSDWIMKIEMAVVYSSLVSSW